MTNTIPQRRKGFHPRHTRKDFMQFKRADVTNCGKMLVVETTDGKSVCVSIPLIKWILNNSERIEGRSN